MLLILAAGSGSRFLASGGASHKLAARIGDASVLEHAIRNAEESGLQWHVVNTGEGGPGMGDSIAAGVRATASGNGWLVIPGDLPLVRPRSLVRVASALALATDHDVVVPRFHGMQGHPVGFVQGLREQLLALSGDKGASSVVRAARERHRVLDLELDDEGIVTDVDTVDDLRHAEALWRSRTGASSG